jgi:hypothetical protein
MSDSNRVQLRYIEETTWGAIPGTRDMQELRFTSEDLVYNVENIKSSEIRDDRQTTDLILTGASASGSINFELSYESYDDFLAGALWSDWSADLAISQDTIAATATGFTVSGDHFTNVSAGQWIKVAGFTGSSGENNGFYLVTVAGSSGGTLTTSPVPRSEGGAGATVTVNGSMLRNGTTEHSYSIERMLQDLDPDVFFPFTGMVVNTFALNVSSKAILTGNFGFIGEGASVSNTAMSTGDVTAATTTDVLAASADVANVLENNTAVDSCLVKELTVALNNNVRGLDAIGSTDVCDIAVGELDLTGTLNAYFKNKDLYEKYIDGTESSLSFRVADDDDNTYIFTFHRIKFETDPVTVGGSNQDIMDNMTWRALRHATYDCMIQIDKFAG